MLVKTVDEIPTQYPSPLVMCSPFDGFLELVILVFEHSICLFFMARTNLGKLSCVFLNQCGINDIKDENKMAKHPCLHPI